jgi:hypothetical protein
VLFHNDDYFWAALVRMLDQNHVQMEEKAGSLESVQGVPPQDDLVHTVRRGWDSEIKKGRAHKSEMKRKSPATNQFIGAEFFSPS